MVTTTSLTPNLDFTAHDLSKSELKEDQEILKLVERQLQVTIREITPVIAYIDKVMGDTRGIEVCRNHEGGQLVLTRSGQWADPQGRVDGNAWKHYKVSNIFTGLEQAFTEAIQKKEQHLHALLKRREMLTKVGAVIRGEI